MTKKIFLLAIFFIVVYPQKIPELKNFAHYYVVHTLLKQKPVVDILIKRLNNNIFFCNNDWELKYPLYAFYKNRNKSGRYVSFLINTILEDDTKREQAKICKEYIQKIFTTIYKTFPMIINYNVSFERINDFCNVLGEMNSSDCYNNEETFFPYIFQQKNPYSPLPENFFLRLDSYVEKENTLFKNFKRYLWGLILRNNAFLLDIIP